jgi:putative copper export protein/mono/diheme cytochrome c family protein
VLPPFDPDGGILLALVRGVAVAALLSAFGTVVFRSVVAPRAFDRMPDAAAAAIERRLLWVAQLSIVAGLLGLLAWLALQAADMADAASLAQTVAAMPAVVTATDFGHLVLAEIAVLLAAGLALGWRDRPWRRRIGLALATAAVALHAGHSHAASMYGGFSLLLLSDVVHLLAAGAWLGGLLPLLLLVRDAPPKAAAVAARWFSPMGKLCIGALALTAAYQGWVMVASIPGLVGTAYGWMALVKLAIFAILTALAAFNRYRLAPALLRGDPAAARRVLIRSLAVQTGFGLAIVTAAAVLSSLPPAMHVQPVWPFAGQFSLAAVSANPDLKAEVIGAALALAGAAALLLAAAVVRRRGSWLAVPLALVIAGFALPHLDLLIVPAYPTSFYRSPTGFAATAIVAGAALYPDHCASCHGAHGRGDGPAAPDLASAHLRTLSDGEMFWWLLHGIDGPDGRLAMAGFAGTLSDDDRWDLIDYVRANNAGQMFATMGEWAPPLQAPGLEAACAGDRKVTLSDFRGQFVRLAFGTAPADIGVGVTTILMSADPAAKARPGLCIADDEAIPPAYGVVTGLGAAALADSQFLIDGDGWLRAMQPGDTAVGWNDPAVLAAEIGKLAAQPIAAKAADRDMPM